MASVLHDSARTVDFEVRVSVKSSIATTFVSVSPFPLLRPIRLIERAYHSEGDDRVVAKIAP